MQTSAPDGVSRTSRMHAVTAAVAWFGVVLVGVLSATGSFAAPEQIEGHLFGHHPSGTAGVFSRVFDTYSYFTVWSNIVVAIAFTLLARRPSSRSVVQRVLLLDALLMITITTVVYWLVLAPTDTWQGWSLLTSPLQHAVVGLLAVVGWIAVGPRGLLTIDLSPKALVVPLIWIALTLIRGAVIDAYPYPFTDVATLGYPGVLVRLAVILVVGLLIAAGYSALDRRLSHRNRSSIQN